MTEGAVDLEMMLDLTAPWCLRVAATLRIPEHIAEGRTGTAELAARTRPSRASREFSFRRNTHG